MVYYTGDIHGDPFEIIKICRKYNITANDILVILGDVGANYFFDSRDQLTKKYLNSASPKLLCIHGNHECRPQNIPSYKSTVWKGGTVFYEEEYPNILFAKDGEIYSLEGKQHLVIGGAYSVDKPYRLSHGWAWWPDEQPSADTKRHVETLLSRSQVDIVLTHTCPFRFEPVEAFIVGIDQSTVDTSTEIWLDKIYEQLRGKPWLCGHWHINKRVDNLHFLFHDVKRMDILIASKATEAITGGSTYEDN